MTLTPERYALRIPVTVLPTGTVQVLGTTYSVDPRKVGAPAMAQVGKTQVDIVIGSVRCTHQRVDHSAMPQRLPEHRRELLGAVHDDRKRNSFQRQCQWELGRDAQVVRALRPEKPLIIGADPHPGDAASAEILP